jgi:hypothetical protein
MPVDPTGGGDARLLAALLARNACVYCDHDSQASGVGAAFELV